MAKLTYAQIIERDQRYKILADLGLRLDLIDTPKLMPRLVEPVAPEHLKLLAESRSLLGEDGLAGRKRQCQTQTHQRRIRITPLQRHSVGGTRNRAAARFWRSADCGRLKRQTPQRPNQAQRPVPTRQSARLGALPHPAGRTDYQRPSPTAAPHPRRLRPRPLRVGKSGLPKRPPAPQRSGTAQRTIQSRHSIKAT